MLKQKQLHNLHAFNKVKCGKKLKRYLEPSLLILDFISHTLLILQKQSTFLYVNAKFQIHVENEP